MCIFSNSCIFFVNQKWDNIWFLCDLCLLNDTQVFVNILKRIIVMLYYYFSVNIISLFVRGIMHPNIDRYLNIQGFGCVMSMSAFLGEHIMPIQWHNFVERSDLSVYYMSIIWVESSSDMNFHLWRRTFYFVLSNKGSDIGRVVVPKVMVNGCEFQFIFFL